MSGNNWIVDTNAVISLLQGNKDLHLTLTQANWIGISVISIIEFLSFPNITDNDKKLFSNFLQRVEIVSLTNDLSFLQRVAALKASTKLKLPDAVIAQCAIESNATLITTDKDFANINSLSVLSFGR